MDIKKYLYSIRDEQYEIEELRQRIAELESSLLPRAIQYDKDKVQTSPEDHTTDIMAKIADYTLMLEKRIRILTERRQYAEQIISRLKDSEERQILDLYFLSGQRMKMDEVAELVNLSTRHTYRIYKQAIEDLRKRCQ